jgi:NAD(P)-dependent dehydrogenase (short-subunit alcohol dehydrogenase family)
MASYATYPSLKDKAVFVTGGGSGIGASIVEHFCGQGAKVAFVDVAKEESEKLVKDLAARKLAAPMFIPCDITDTAALQRAIADSKAKLGAFRVLVNNAAHDQRHAIDEVTPKYWDERVAVNLKHQFFAAQAVYKDMAAAGGGSIVNLGSISWMKKQGNMPAYTTSKSAVQGLTNALARDLGPMNIRVNSVVPGWIMTERQIKLWLTPEAEKELLQGQCIKRKLVPADIARMVLFLASDDSDGCSGQHYIVDGGWV